MRILLYPLVSGLTDLCGGHDRALSDGGDQVAKECATLRLGCVFFCSGRFFLAGYVQMHAQRLVQGGIVSFSVLHHPCAMMDRAGIALANTVRVQGSHALGSQAGQHKRIPFGMAANVNVGMRIGGRTCRCQCRIAIEYGGTRLVYDQLGIYILMENRINGADGDTGHAGRTASFIQLGDKIRIKGDGIRWTDVMTAFASRSTRRGGLGIRVQTVFLVDIRSFNHNESLSQGH